MASDQQISEATSSPSKLPAPRYQVVARRYRPRSFSELVGQEHVSHALENAILAGRVGHAYLFTGARGVGKTSAARIFGKALNCVQGPSPRPCNACDVCLSIDAGEDVDVLEIDGASNRGIDEIRQIRSNVHIRPSRSPYKVYIIDEVHMLTVPAFNALLKTLEEPPEHVKFIFCTTDPEKLPITVQSRCQRHDFAPIVSESILDRLREICVQEGREVDDAGLALLARRAAGSMRDSQSLLEQLLAFCGSAITLEDVHSMLGIADHGTLESLVQCLVNRDAAGALEACDHALQLGIEAGHLTEQLLAYWRDLLVAAVRGSAKLALHVSPEDWEEITRRGEQLGPATILAGAQIFDQTLVRMRQSTHARILLEMAVIRVCQLDQLDDLGILIQQLRQGDGIRANTGGSSGAGQGGGRAPNATSGTLAANSRESSSRSATGRVAAKSAEKKTTELTDREDSPTPEPDRPRGGMRPRASVDAGPQAKSGSGDSHSASESRSLPKNGHAAPADSLADQANSSSQPSGSGQGLDPRTVMEVWQRALGSVEDMAADFAACADGVAISAPNRLVVTFLPAYNLQKEKCERPDRKTMIEKALSRIVGSPVTIEFRVTGEAAPATVKSPVRSSRHRLRETERHELVQQVIELFDAEILRVEAARPS